MKPSQNPAFTDPTLKELFDFWRSIGKEGSIPRRQDFEPMAIPALLPDLYLVELTQPERRFRYRLVGTRVAQNAGFDATGSYLDELSCGTTMSFVVKLLQRCVDLRQPVASASSFGGEGRAYLVVRRVFLPLTFGRGTVDQILCGQTFDQSVQPMPLGGEIDRSSPQYRELAVSTPDAEHEYFDL